MGRCPNNTVPLTLQRCLWTHLLFHPDSVTVPGSDLLRALILFLLTVSLNIKPYLVGSIHSCVCVCLCVCVCMCVCMCVCVQICARVYAVYNHSKYFFSFFCFVCNHIIVCSSMHYLSYYEYTLNSLAVSSSSFGRVMDSLYD